MKKYLHLIRQKITVGPTVLKQYFMVVSNQDTLPPGHHTVVPCTYEMAVAHANEIGATIVGEPYEEDMSRTEADVKQSYKNVVKKVKPKVEGKAKQPSKACLNDARKAMGVAPYNQGVNYLVGDGYFAMSCIKKYGEVMWDRACEIVRGEK